MAIDVDRGFEVGSAIIVEDAQGNLKSITFSDGAPWLEPVLNAPIGSLHLLTDGTAYIKSGIGDAEADWGNKLSNVIADPGSAGAIKFCFRNGDQDFIELSEGAIAFTFRDGTDDPIEAFLV